MKILKDSMPLKIESMLNYKLILSLNPKNRFDEVVK